MLQLHSKLSPSGNSSRTAPKRYILAKNTKKCMEPTHVIIDCRFHKSADILCGQTFIHGLNMRVDCIVLWIYGTRATKVSLSFYVLSKGR